MVIHRNSSAPAAEACRMMNVHFRQIQRIRKQKTQTMRTAVYSFHIQQKNVIIWQA